MSTSYGYGTLLYNTGVTSQVGVVSDVCKNRTYCTMCNRTASRSRWEQGIRQCTAYAIPVLKVVVAETNSILVPRIQKYSRTYGTVNPHDAAVVNSVEASSCTRYIKHVALKGQYSPLPPCVVPLCRCVVSRGCCS